MKIKWDNQSGIVDSDGRQLIQFVKNYASEKQRRAMGKFLVEKWNEKNGGK